ncbi:hypothetical protein F0562_022784 [Nyssa sinensis]|uniref:Uncharacterized protein n=1 Tax=Nyssa sinensis TaxID=561372 RepID=A0A5J5BIQ9_9ASTE|nr:hypothetical protein F0562_022784 [Nyssa sinensis]
MPVRIRLAEEQKVRRVQIKAARKRLNLAVELRPPSMATTYAFPNQNSSQRALAMVLALASAVVLSPLYLKRQNDHLYETRWSSGFVLPMVLAGLIIAIKTTSSLSMQSGARATLASVF